MSTAEVTEYEPNRRVAFKSTSGPIAYEWNANLESINGSIKLMFSGHADTGGFSKLGEPIVMRAFKRQQEADLANLKKLMKSEAWDCA